MSVHLSASQAARLGIHGTGKAPRRPRGLTARFDWADVLRSQIVALGLPEPARELLLVPGRKFRTDLAWVDRLVFVEVDGGEFTHGRHGRGRGMQSDCVKWNALTAEGWTGFRFVGSMVRNGEAVTFLERVLKTDG